MPVLKLRNKNFFSFYRYQTAQDFTNVRDYSESSTDYRWRHVQRHFGPVEFRNTLLRGRSANWFFPLRK